MRRREFITLVGGAAAWPVTARAQQPDRVRRIGVLQPLAANDPDAQPRVSAFQQRMQELGWTDGRNVHIDYRGALATPLYLGKIDDAGPARIVGLTANTSLGFDYPRAYVEEHGADPIAVPSLYRYQLQRRLQAAAH